MKKSRLFTSLLIIIILLSSVLVAKFFIGNNKLLAQVYNPDNPSEWEVNVYMPYYPETGTPSIWGQTDLVFNFTNIDPIFFGDNVTDFYIEVYNNPDANATDYIGTMNIIEYFQHDKNGESRTYWTFRVDTMDFENFTNYYFRIRAYVGSVEVLLIYNVNYNNVFGPYIIHNNPKIIRPQQNTTIKSNVDIISRLDGMAQGVLYNILDSSGDIVNSITVDTADNSGYDFTYWTGNWNSNNVSNGPYILTLSYTTLEGNFRSDVYEMMITVDNSVAGGNPEPPICDPIWQCENWPIECPSDGILTRICLATNCDETLTRTEEQTCLYIPPGDPDGDGSDPNPPPVGDPNLPPEPLPVPTINMQYPGQGDVVSGDIVLKAITDINISSLEFFYTETDSSVDEFIGGADRSSNNNLLWQRIWGTDQIPDGEYYVFARAEMANGNIYISDYIIITIDHQNTNIQSDGEQPVIQPEEIQEVDSDGDGIDDITEQNIGTDINSPEVSSKLEELIDQAVLDGKITTELAATLKTGYIIEQPKNSNLQPSFDIIVNKIENISPRIGQNNLVISGTGPPNTVLKLYIYSDPIVVTTKTDASGNFTYTLDKDLLDGEHEVYVTINDDTGKITKQSSPLTFFIRRAQAVTEEEYLRGDVNIISDSSSVVNKYVIPAVITVVALMLVFIGIVMLKRKQEEI